MERIETFGIKLHIFFLESRYLLFWNWWLLSCLFYRVLIFFNFYDSSYFVGVIYSDCNRFFIYNEWLVVSLMWLKKLNCRHLQSRVLNFVWSEPNLFWSLNLCGPLVGINKSSAIEQSIYRIWLNLTDNPTSFHSLYSFGTCSPESFSVSCLRCRWLISIHPFQLIILAVSFDKIKINH